MVDLLVSWPLFAVNIICSFGHFTSADQTTVWQDLAISIKCLFVVFLLEKYKRKFLHSFKTANTHPFYHSISIPPFSIHIFSISIDLFLFFFTKKPQFLFLILTILFFLHFRYIYSRYQQSICEEPKRSNY